MSKGTLMKGATVLLEVVLFTRLDWMATPQPTAARSDVIAEIGASRVSHMTDHPFHNNIP